MSGKEILYNTSSETLETFGKNIRIIQNKTGYRFNSDSVILVDYFFERFKKHPKKEKHLVADLGAGSGILSIMLAARNENLQCWAFEIQRTLLGLMERNIKLNKIEKQVFVVSGDYTEKEQRFYGFFDSVICNPPYKKLGTGKASINEEKLIARHEVKVNLVEIAESINYMLRPGGDAYFVYPSFRLAELIYCFKATGLEPKFMKVVYHDQKSDSDIFLMKFVKGGRTGLKIAK